MEEIQKDIRFLKLEKHELSEKEAQLISEAEKVVKNAYAPYSGFKVGAAVLLDNGSVVKGTNQENEAYPSGLCAERVAVFSAKSDFPGAIIKAIAIAAEPNAGQTMNTFSPCGACRQVLMEYQELQDHPFPILLSGSGQREIIKFEDMEQLLPFSFSVSGLGNK